MKLKSVFLAAASIGMLTNLQIKAQQKDSSNTNVKTPVPDFDFKQPLFKLDSLQMENKNKMLRYSALTKYREGIRRITTLPYLGYLIEKPGTAKFSMYNLSRFEMLAQRKYKPNQVILEVKDPSTYMYDPKSGVPENEWLRKNALCYELMLPDGVAGDNTIIDDLSAMLGVKCGPQQRVAEVMVLVRTSDQDKIKTAGNAKSDAEMELKGMYNNVPLARFTNAFGQVGMPIVIDETGYKGNVDLKLKISNWYDLNAVRKELNKYDLDLKPEKKEVTMFVITEIK